jgi:hypothetical protein
MYYHWYADYLLGWWAGFEGREHEDHVVIVDRDAITTRSALTHHAAHRAPHHAPHHQSSSSTSLFLFFSFSPHRNGLFSQYGLFSRHECYRYRSELKENTCFTMVKQPVTTGTAGPCFFFLLWTILFIYFYLCIII